MKIRILYEVYIDGSGDGRYGYWITKEGLFMIAIAPRKQKQKPVIFRSKTPITNNVAEYLALKALLEDIPNNSVLNIYSDSRLVVCQLNGYLDYERKCFMKTENPKFWGIQSDIKNLIKEKELNIRLTWVPREENKFGNYLERMKRREKRRRRRKRNC